VPVLPALPVAIPLVVAAVMVGAAPVLRRRVADILAVATALAVTGIGVAELAQTLGGPSVTWFGGWTPRSGIALGIAFVVDPIGAGMVTFGGVLMVAALTFSWRYFETVGTLFHALMLVLLAGVAGFSSTGDLFNMFVFFELLSVSAFALAGYKIEDPGSLQGALNFAVTNSAGAIMLLSGIGLLYARTGALNLAQIGETLARTGSDRLVTLALVLVLVGFFVKAAVVPFHFWLADAYALAPTPVCVLFAGLLSELGVYAIARIYWTVFSGTFDPRTPGFRAALITGATITALLGGVMCVLQRHLARMLAYATVSHVGLTLFGIALLSPEGLAGAALYAAADGLVKGGLFVMVGIVAHRFGTLDELRLQGRGREIWWAAPLLVIGALGLAGAPPVGTFVGKALIEEGAEGGKYWTGLLFTVASALTAAAVLRVTARLFTGWGAGEPTMGEVPAAGQAAPAQGGEVAPSPAEARGATHDVHREVRPAEGAQGRESRPDKGEVGPDGEAGPNGEGGPDAGPGDREDEDEKQRELRVARTLVGPSMVAPALMLLGAAVVIGLVPGLSDRTVVTAARFADRLGYVATVLGGAPAPAHAHPPTSGRLLAAAPWTAATVLLAVAGAWLALFGSRIPRALRHGGAKVTSPVIRALEALHSGNLGDSVTWLTIGSATFGIVLAAVLR
jgi:multicomponent Na+:H+ antiporter subunit D